MTLGGSHLVYKHVLVYKVDRKSGIVKCFVSGTVGGAANGLLDRFWRVLPQA